MASSKPARLGPAERPRQSLGQGMRGLLRMGGDTAGRKPRPLAVQSIWSGGPRTPAWDALWRRLLAEITTGIVDPVAAPETKEQDGDEGRIAVPH